MKNAILGFSKCLSEMSVSPTEESTSTRLSALLMMILVPSGEKDAEYISPEYRMLRYYIRLHSEDRAGILSKIAGVLGGYNISIASVIQKEAITEYVPIVITTHRANEAGMRKAKNEIERFSFVNGHVMIIPIEDFDNTGE